MRQRVLAGFLAGVLLAFLGTGGGGAAPPPQDLPPHVPGELLVQFRPW